MRSFAVKRSDGGVSVLRLSSKTKREATEEIARLPMTGRWKRNGWTVVSFKEVPNAAVPRPEERYDLYRDAWEGVDDSGPVVNMPKARAIHMDRIRPVRDAALTKLDRKQMAAFGKGNQAEVAKIEAEKQKLRDIPQTFDLSAAKTTDDLKAMWPTELPARKT